MLLVVLMITLVLLGVPLVTKLLAAPATPTLPQPIHLSLLESLHTSNQNLVVSPSLLQETLANLAKWTQGGTREQLCSRVNCTLTLASSYHQVAYLLPSQGTFTQQGREWVKTGQVLLLDVRVNKAREKVQSWLHGHGGREVGTRVAEELDISQISVLSTLILKGRLASRCQTWSRKSSDFIDSKLVSVEESLPVKKLPRGIVVRLALQEGLLLDLAMPNSADVTVMDLINSGQPDEGQFVETSVKIQFPLFSVHSENHLKGLDKLGLDRITAEEADFTPLVKRVGGMRVDRLYHGISFDLQCNPRNVSSSSMDSSSANSAGTETFLFHRPFLFIVHDQALPLPLLMGLVDQSVDNPPQSLPSGT